MRCPLFLLVLALLPSLALRAADPPPPLRAMSCNIRYSAARDGADAWLKRRAFLVETIAASQPDLLGLQEVLADQAEFLAAALPDLRLVGGGRDDGKAKGEASPILFRTARFELLESGQFWLSETPEVVGSKGWDATLPRICTVAKLRDKLAGATLVYVNTHWDNKGVRARAESATLMRARASAMAGTDAILITGDLNLQEDAEPYRLLLGGGSDGVQLVDSYREVHPVRAADEATFHGFTGERAGSRIDFILHSPQLTAHAAEIIHASKAGRYPSDHFPVTAELWYR